MSALLHHDCKLDVRQCRITLSELTINGNSWTRHGHLARFVSLLRQQTRLAPSLWVIFVSWWRAELSRVFIMVNDDSA